MKLEKAIEILTIWKLEGECQNSKELVDAEDLALEALKHIKRQKIMDAEYKNFLLIGETID